MTPASQPAARAPAGDRDPVAIAAGLRAMSWFRDTPDDVITRLVASGQATTSSLPRDAFLEPPQEFGQGVLCIVIAGQVAVGVFDRETLAARGRVQRDATLGEEDGTLMPPGPLARSAKQNAAMFAAGEVFNLGALLGDERGRARGRVLAIARHGRVPREHGDGLARPRSHRRPRPRWRRRSRSRRRVSGRSPASSTRSSTSTCATASRSRGPTVRVRQLDLCIDCKQCEDACEDRHGARRLTLGGYELGLLDFVYTCRTCDDARCLSPCEHDAIKRDAQDRRDQDRRGSLHRLQPVRAVVSRTVRSTWSTSPSPRCRASTRASRRGSRRATSSRSARARVARRRRAGSRTSATTARATPIRHASRRARPAR